MNEQLLPAIDGELDVTGLLILPGGQETTVSGLACGWERDGEAKGNCTSSLLQAALTPLTTFGGL